MIIITENNIWMRQGDAGQIIFGGLPTDKAYSIYLSLYNEETEKIIKQFLADSFDISTGIAVFSLKASDTDDVKPGEYIYGLKVCYGDQEDTLIPEIIIENGNVIEQPAPSFIVANKIVEGINAD